MFITQKEISKINSQFLWSRQDKDDIINHIAALQAQINPVELLRLVAQDEQKREIRDLKRKLAMAELMQRSLEYQQKRETEKLEALSA